MPPTAYPFNVVDVFTERRLEGNQLGVFLDAEEIPDDRMQAIARQLNVAETIFLSAPRTPDGAASARIFTPAREVPFAGHPTIGAAFALCTAGRIPAGAASFVLEERVGPVPIRLESRDPFFAWLRTPPIAFGKTYDREAVARALGVTPDDLIEGAPVQVVSAGNPFAYVALQTPEAVDRATLSEPALRCAARRPASMRRASSCSHRARAARTRACSRRWRACPKIPRRAAQRGRLRPIWRRTDCASGARVFVS